MEAGEIGVVGVRVCLMMEKCTETEPVTVQLQSMMVILALEKNLILRIAQVPI